MGNYILVLDVGTTNIKAFLFDKNGEIFAQARRRQNYIMDDEPGQVEQDPREVWELSKQVLGEVIESKNLKANDIEALGISSYRASFLFWDKKTGKCHSNVITWQDSRSAEYAEKMTEKFKALRSIAKVINALKHSTRMLTASMIKFDSTYPSASTGFFLETNNEVNQMIKDPNT